MNFLEIRAEVLRLTNRPDKTTSTDIAINKAVSYCTLKGSFRRDLVEASLAVDATLYGDTVSIAGFTRFRRFTYVKPTGVKKYLTFLAEDKIFTPKDQMQPNVYYVAGTSLTYTLSALTPTLEVGYLTYAPTLDAITNIDYWMFDIMPYAIIDLAAAMVFAGIGDDASANRHERLGMEFYNTLKRDLAIQE